MDENRLELARSAMIASDLDALICRLPANVLMLSGHWSLIGFTFLVFPREGSPLIVVPHCDEREAKEDLWNADCVSFRYGVLDAGNPYDEVTAVLKKFVSGRGWSRIGVEGAFETVAPPWNSAEPAIPAATTRSMFESLVGTDRLVDATDLLLDLRSRKTEYERERLRVANEISAFGLAAFRDKVDVGISSVELVAEVERSVMIEGTGYRGAKRVRAFAQVSTGIEETKMAYRPMQISTTRKIQSGEVALLELAVVADGFWSDRTRPRAAGVLDARTSDVFDAVLSAQVAAIQAVAPGRLAGDVDTAARTIIHDAGFTDNEFLHVTGHGLGFRYHEPVPLILPGGTTEIQTGMVHSVEPGVYSSEVGGIRIEDDVFVTGDGAEIMGPFPTSLSE